MKRKYVVLAVLVLIGTAAFIFTLPKHVDDSAIAGMLPDIEVGQQVFIAGGCGSCHSASNSTGDAKLELVGGQAFPSEFGTFYAPNISPDTAAGIGKWRAIDLVNAMRHGTSPDRKHYFPVFPYASYGRVTLQDIVSLHGYLQTLPPMPTQNRPHDVGFPFNIRASLGGWKLLFSSSDWIFDPADTPELQRGRYLVEGLGHCGECHTPRNALGGLETSRWLAGAPNPTGRGNIPNITPAKLKWSEDDLLAYFQWGTTPDFDTAGGLMVEVIENLATMPEADLRAIITYLKAIPPVE